MDRVGGVGGAVRGMRWMLFGPCTGTGTGTGTDSGSPWPWQPFRSALGPLQPSHRSHFPFTLTMTMTMTVTLTLAVTLTLRRSLTLP